MWKSVTGEKLRWLAGFMVLGAVCIFYVPAMGGTYLDSAHGNSGYGVNRSTIDGKYTDFATGNCAHCHESHASVPAPHTLFAVSFNTAGLTNPYLKTDDFCFYCHNETEDPRVLNKDYSTTFGGATDLGPQAILETFNQASYHNLNDISSFLLDNTHYPDYSTWYAKLGNPCSACHNSHLAKRNWDIGQANFPLLSAISLPGDSSNLWGETQLMSSYVGYEAPYSDAITKIFEPAGVGAEDGGKTPDYAAFCIACHTSGNTIASTALGRNLKTITWTSTELQKDKHGAMARDGAATYLLDPYSSVASQKTNFYLSCMDCHEAHGSPNIMLLRRRINGVDLEGVVSSTDNMSYVCKRCHPDDLAAAGGTGQADRWEFIHHTATDAPYAESVCTDCHSGGDTTPIACGNCHGHGMDDSWAGARATLRKTF